MNNIDIGRYMYQTLVQGVGVEGQKKIQQGQVAVVGLGGLGSTIAEQLVRAGVGHITLIDRDRVELSNLHRQTLYCEQDAKQSRWKAQAAADYLKKLNSSCKLSPIVAELNKNSIDNLLLNPLDLILDGTDNFQTRETVNRFCIENRVPWIYGGCIATGGMVMPVIPGKGPCLSCVLPQFPPRCRTDNCRRLGVLLPAVAVTASLQVIEAIRLLVGTESTFTGKMYIFDLWRQEFDVIDLSHSRDPNCPACAGM